MFANLDYLVILRIRNRNAHPRDLPVRDFEPEPDELVERIGEDLEANARLAHEVHDLVERGLQSERDVELRVEGEEAVREEDALLVEAASEGDFDVVQMDLVHSLGPEEDGRLQVDALVLEADEVVRLQEVLERAQFGVI